MWAFSFWQHTWKEHGPPRTFSSLIWDGCPGIVQWLKLEENGGQNAVTLLGSGAIYSTSLYDFQFHWLSKIVWVIILLQNERLLCIVTNLQVNQCNDGENGFYTDSFSSQRRNKILFNLHFSITDSFLCTTKAFLQSYIVTVQALYFLYLQYHYIFYLQDVFRFVYHFDPRSQFIFLQFVLVAGFL